MGLFVGLDVGKDRTAVCVLDANEVKVLEKEVATEPDELLDLLGPFRPTMELAATEAGSLGSWLARELSHRGLLTIQIDARRLQRYASASAAKTDRSDALVIAQALRVGMYQEVHDRSSRARALRTLLTHREGLLRQARAIELSIRGTLRSNGIRLYGAGGKKFRPRVLALLARDPVLMELLLPGLDARDAVLAQHEILDRKAQAMATQSRVASQLMTIPGVGPITALAFVCAIDDPRRFESSDKVASYIGLVPRIHQSGEMTRRGRISKLGDKFLRTCLFRAAMTHLRARAPTDLQRWTLRVAERRGRKRAIIACARKLAIIMHRMWLSGEEFRLTSS